MKSKPRTWLQATLATVGAGALALGGAAMPAFAEDSAPVATLAEQSPDNKFEAAAATANAGATAEELEAQEVAGEILVSDAGHIIEIDDAQDAPALSLLSAFDAARTPVPGTPEGGSLPGASVTIFLDFDGHTFKNQGWNAEQGAEELTFVAAAGLSDEFKEQVWKGVAEDYAPFNINVTTSDPGADALYKTADDDNTYGSHVVITDSYDEVLDAAYDTSGLAFRGGAGSDYLTGALVFTKGVGGGNSADATAKSVADTASHEAGHNFGVTHSSIDGSPFGEYYYPQTGVWGPIMGATYAVPISQWTDGSYAGATGVGGIQDQLGTIVDRSSAEREFVGWTFEDGTPAPGGSQVCVGEGDPQNPQPGDWHWLYVSGNDCEGSDKIFATFHWTDRADNRADDVGDTIGSALALDNDGTFAFDEGVIGVGDDVDVFEVEVEEGELSAEVQVADFAPNLNTKLSLLDADGNEIASDSPAVVAESPDVASGLGSSISESVDAGTYYLAVEGVGFGDPSAANINDAGGFSSYGSMGNYSLTGEAAAPVEAIAAPAITSPADGSESDDVSPTFSGTGVEGATVNLTVTAADGTEYAATATVAADGSWSVELTDDLAPGAYTAVATQTLDGDTSKKSKAVAFEVTKADDNNGGGDDNGDGDDNGTGDGDDDSNNNDGTGNGDNDGDDNSNTDTNGNDDNGDDTTTVVSNDGDNLANTGASDFVPYVLGAAGVLLVAGIAVAVASMRQRKLLELDGDL